MMSQKASAKALIDILENEWYLLWSGDMATIGRLQAHAEILRGHRFRANALNVETTALEYVVERYFNNDRLVCKICPYLIAFEDIVSRAEVMRACLRYGLEQTIRYLLVDCEVSAPRDALFLAFQGRGGYKVLRSLLALKALELGADIRWLDEDGNSMLHLVCDRVATAGECDHMVVWMLLCRDADPLQRNNAGDLPIQRMLGMPLPDEPLRGQLAEVNPNFLRQVLQARRHLLDAAEARRHGQPWPASII